MKIAVHGACGRMGRRICSLALRQDDLDLVCGLEAPGHPDAGKDIGLLIGMGEMGVPVKTDYAEVIKKVDCIIDFSVRTATSALLEMIGKAPVKLVVGTTGLEEETVRKIRTLSEEKSVVFSPNMSVGINLIFKIVPKIAKILGDEYDIEVVEMHHRHKIDAPSGTALKIAENIAEEMGRKPEDVFVYGRQGFTGERRREEIGVLSMRGGDVIGEHTITFAGPGERVEVTHRAHNRDTFARGAVLAAQFLINREKGLFNMADVLGISE